MKNKRQLWIALLSGIALSQPQTMTAAESTLSADNTAITQQDTKKVSLNLRNASGKQLINELQSQTGLNFDYDEALLKLLPATSLKIKEEPIASALERIFGNSDVAYEISGNTVNLRFKKLNAKAQQKLTGTITDPDGIPVIGATVLVKGTNNGVVTDLDGNYSINVSPYQKLMYSYIGMEMQEVEFKGARKLDIQLAYDKATTVEEVVVTGVFKKAKESYTGSVASVTSEELKISRGQNVLQTLRNVDSSINFAANNLIGSNPNSLPEINIRGNSSLPTDMNELKEGVRSDANTPLIIMDGFEISLMKLMDYNEDEIESINILKDASATAIYGSRGANGVIVVISKKPEAGKLKINLEIGTNISIPDLSSYDLLNAKEKLQLELGAGLYDSKVNPIRQQELRKIYNNRWRLAQDGANTDWKRQPVRTGVGQRYNLRLEGGSEEFRWGTSLSYNDQEGAMKDSYRRTFNGGITLMYNVKNLIFRNYTSVGFNNSRESKYGSFSNYIDQQPYNVPYDENGKLVRYFEGFTADPEYPVQNPLYDASLNTFNKNGYLELINNFSIEWNILKELTLRGQLGISYKHGTSDYFLPAEHSYFVGMAEYKTDEGFFRRGLYRYGIDDYLQMDGNVTLSYNKTLNDVHQIYVGADYAISERNNTVYNFEAEGFSNEDMDLIINARQYFKNGQPHGFKTITRRIGLTGNANYTFDNRYFIDLSYRMDGSSAFGSNKKYAPFWSVGMGWNLHNEKFLKGNDIVNSLRLKASYGETGSMLGSAVGATSTYQFITDNKYGNWAGAMLQGLGNPDLTWQKTIQTNIGVEFGLWQNRLKGSFDYYTKKTSNLLSYMNLPGSMGFDSYLANVGEVKNHGFEASMSAYLLRDNTRDINWIVSGQLVYNKNEITKLSEAIKAQNEKVLAEGADIPFLLYEGRPQNSIYAVRSLGIDPSTGEEIFLDRNGNITDEWKAKDKVFMGSRDPKFRGTAGTTFIWKDFTFNMAFGFHWGGKMYNSTLLNRVEVTTGDIQEKNVDKRVLYDRWNQPGDVAFFKKLGSYTRASSRFVMDDNVFELQNVGLQYRLHNDWLQNTTKLSSVIFGINITDLLYLSSVKMERGTDYPFARSVQGSVKLVF